MEKFAFELVAILSKHSYYYIKLLKKMIIG